MPAPFFRPSRASIGLFGWGELVWLPWRVCNRRRAPSGCLNLKLGRAVLGLEQHGRSFLVRAAECRQTNRRGLWAF